MFDHAARGLTFAAADKFVLVLALAGRLTKSANSNVAQVSKPAVSTISNRQRGASELASDISARPQAGSPAIQQVWKPALRLCPQPCSSSARFLARRFR